MNMKPETRQQIADFVRGIIAPGGRAFFPYELEQAVRQVAAETPMVLDGVKVKVGEIWAADESDPLREAKVERLQEVVRTVSRTYRAKQSVRYEGLVSLVYALSYLPKNLHKIQFLLLELFEHDLLPSALEILDIGTAVGTVPLAVADFFELLHQAHLLFDEPYSLVDVRVTCVDASASNLRLFKKICGHLTISSSNFEAVCLPPLRVDSGGKWLGKLPEGRRYNLIFASNFLAELIGLPIRERSRLILNAAEYLTDDGLFLIVEPADKINSNNYHAVQYQLTRHGLYVLFPCPQSNHVPSQAYCAKCWGFRAETLKVPAMMKPLMWSRRRQEETDDDFKWCYGIFSRRLVRPNVPLTRLQPPIRQDERFDQIGQISVRVMSPPGNRKRIRICGAEARSDLAVLSVDEHQVLPPVSYGQALHLKNPLVRQEGSAPAQILVDVQTEARPERKAPRRSWHRDSALETPPPKDVYSPRLLVRDPESKTMEYFLRRLFGFERFRHGQIDLIAKTLSGQDVLGIMATSGGKSLCFQFPAMLLPGVAIVVAPLLSLVQDQIYNLKTRFGFDQVERINGELSAAEREIVLERMTAGYYKLIYVTPEQLLNERVIAKLKETARRQGISLFAVDEVHCLSQWGHDFRPAYLNLRRRFSEIDEASPLRGPTPIVALTATASEYVIEDVIKELRLEPEAMQRYSFDRPELSFEVLKVARSSKTSRYERLLQTLEHQLKEVLGSQTRPGIIFVPYTGDGWDDTRSWWLFSVEGLAHELAKAGYRTGSYHGKLDLHERQRMQEAFKNGEFDFLVATKGFGMGIDKADIRFVIHFCMPDSLESYYQQAGRAGRDSQHSHCVLLYLLEQAPQEAEERGEANDDHRSDYDRQLYFIEEHYPKSKKEIQEVWAYLTTSTTILRDENHDILYQARDEIIIGLQWMTRAQINYLAQLKSQGEQRAKVLKAWNQLLDAIRNQRVDSPTYRRALKTLTELEPALPRAATQRDWDYLLYRVKRNPRYIEIRDAVYRALDGAQDASLQAAAIADLMRDKLDRTLLNRKRALDTQLARILDALRRMRFLHAWDYVQTEATFRRKKSWQYIEANVRDPIVLDFIRRLREMSPHERYLSQVPDEARRNVDLVRQATSFGMKVTEIQAVLDFLYHRHFVTKPRYRQSQLALQIDDTVLSLTQKQKEAAFARELKLLYLRREREIQMLNDMVRYIETSDCRRQSIAGYFLARDQERIIVRCNFCDNCCPDRITGDAAEVQEATRRQASLIKQLQSWLERDFEQNVPASGEELTTASTFALRLAPQKHETPIWDLVRAVCANHLENRFVESWRALYLMMLFDYERGNFAASQQQLERLKEHVGHDWRAFEQIAQTFLNYDANQYPALELGYQAARELSRPPERQRALLRGLVKLDDAPRKRGVQQNPDYLYQLGHIEAQLEGRGYETYLNRALDHWLSANQFLKITEAAKELLSSSRTLCAFVPAWAERIAQRSPDLWFVEALKADAQPIHYPIIADALQRTVPKLPLSAQLLAQAAKIAGDLRDQELQSRICQQILSLPAQGRPVEQRALHLAHKALASFYSPANQRADAQKYAHNILQAARTAPDNAQALAFYRLILPEWPWQRLQEEQARWQATEKRKRLVPQGIKLWLESDPRARERRVAAYLAANLADWSIRRSGRREESPSLEPILKMLSLEALRAHPRLAVSAIWVTRDADLVAHLGRVALTSQQPLNLATQERIFNAIGSWAQAADLVKQITNPPTKRVAFTALLKTNTFPASWQEVEQWLDSFGEPLLAEAGADGLRFLQESLKQLPLHSSEACDHALTLLQPIVAPLFERPSLLASAHQSWQPACIQSKEALQRYISSCRHLLGGQKWADRCLDTLLENNQGRQLIAWSGALPTPRWQQAIHMSNTLQTFLQDTQYDASQLKFTHLKYLVQAFKPADHDPEQHDMLAATLAQLRHIADPKWKTPVALHIEALALAGRLNLARQLSAQRAIKAGLKGVPIEQYIQQNNCTQRHNPTNPDYPRIAAQLLPQTPPAKPQTSTWLQTIRDYMRKWKELFFG